MYIFTEANLFVRTLLSGVTLTDMRLLLNFTHNIHREKQGCTLPLSKANCMSIISYL